MGFIPDSQKAVILSFDENDSYFEIYNLNSGENLFQLQDYIQVTDFSFQPLKSYCAIAAVDQWVFLDIESQKVLCEIDLPQQNQSIESIEFHPDGLLLATGHSKGCLNIWDIRIQKVIKTIQTNFDDCLESITFSNKGYQFATQHSN